MFRAVSRRYCCCRPVVLVSSAELTRPAGCHLWPQVLAWAQGKKKFQAIDRAIGEEGLKVVILLRLSPLLPLAASNYLYGLTSVSLADYALGSWLGMLPGTVAYVSFGEVSKNVINGQDSAPGFSWWQGGIALGATLLAITYVGSIASQALTDIEATMDDQ